MTKQIANDRAGGVTLWRRIADDLRLDIVGGKLAPGAKLPSEFALAERFGVNRHTVRRAIAALQRDGILKSERGSGTYVDRAERLSYPIGRRTRFSEGLAGQAQHLERRLLASQTEPAPAAVARALGLRAGARTSRLDLLSLANGRPLARATNWLDVVRFPDFPQRFAEVGSISGALALYGIADYVRETTRISARHADAEDTKHLRIAPGSILLVSEAIDTDAEGKPILYGLSRFAAERIELLV